MPKPISLGELQQYRKILDVGGVDAAGQVYKELYDKGYDYAGWAEGVAKGNKLTGWAALYFLGEAYYDDACQFISNEKIRKVKSDMAKRTLDEYIRVAQEEGGELTRDLKFDEVNDIHKEVFDKNGLEIDNWTLSLPMKVIREKHGEVFQERVWQAVRDTGGDGVFSALSSID